MSRTTECSPLIAAAVFSARFYKSVMAARDDFLDSEIDVVTLHALYPF